MRMMLELHLASLLAPSVSLHMLTITFAALQWTTTSSGANSTGISRSCSPQGKLAAHCTQYQHSKAQDYTTCYHAVGQYLCCFLLLLLYVLVLLLLPTIFIVPHLPWLKSLMHFAITDGAADPSVDAAAAASRAAALLKGMPLHDRVLRFTEFADCQARNFCLACCCRTSC